MTLILLLILPD